MADSSSEVPSWRLAAIETKLDDHESRLRNTEKDVSAAHDEIRKVKAENKADHKLLETRVGFYALAGAMIGTIGSKGLALLNDWLMKP